MTYKKTICIDTLLIFILCFITHFLYTLFPNPIFAIFFPVNESIWEHMKMLYSTILLYGVFKWIFLYIKKIKTVNFLIKIFIEAFLAIPIYLLLFLPIYSMFGEHMWISISLLLITIFIVEIIDFKILTKKNLKYQVPIGLTCITIGFIIMGYLTYYPPRMHLFLDTQNEKYGINYYIVD